MKAKKLPAHEVAQRSTTEARCDVSKTADAHDGRTQKKETPPVEPSAKLAASSAAVPSKWRWHHNVLCALEQRLLGRRNNLRQAVVDPLEPHSLDEADSASDEFDHDLALTQLSASQDALLEIGEALQRISDGSYGTCEETGEAIPAERLKVIPWTRFIRPVEERLEREGVVNFVRMNKSRTVRNHGQVLFKPGEENGDDTPED